MSRKTGPPSDPSPPPAFPHLTNPPPPPAFPHLTNPPPPPAFPHLTNPPPPPAFPHLTNPPPPPAFPHLTNPPPARPPSRTLPTCPPATAALIALKSTLRVLGVLRGKKNLTISTHSPPENPQSTLSVLRVPCGKKKLDSLTHPTRAEPQPLTVPFRLNKNHSVYSLPLRSSL